MRNLYLLGFFVLIWGLILSNTPSPNEQNIVKNREQAYLNMETNCLPYKSVIFQEFSYISERTCLGNFSEQIIFRCPCDFGNKTAGQMSYNCDTRGMEILLNTPDRNTVAHELYHAYQYVCRPPWLDLEDNKTVEMYAIKYEKDRKI